MSIRFSDRIILTLRRTADRLEFWPVRMQSTIDGFTSRSEGFCLYDLARSLPRGAVCCEIGIWKGRSAFCIAKGLDGGLLCAVDTFDASGDSASTEIYKANVGAGALEFQFLQNMRRVGVADKVKIVKGRSDQVAGAVPDELDLLFVDGDHSVDGCRSDYEKYFPKLKLYGLIVFHDYDSRRKALGPTYVIERILLPSGSVDFVKCIDRLWIGKKVGHQLHEIT